VAGNGGRTGTTAPVTSPVGHRVGGGGAWVDRRQRRWTSHAQIGAMSAVEIWVACGAVETSHLQPNHHALSGQGGIGHHSFITNPWHI
jgi:hypothetical protein